MATTPLQQVAALGQSVWVDYVSRHLLDSGELERMMDDDALTGMTSNPTIFQKAIAEGSDYDDQLKELLSQDGDMEAKELFLNLAVQDIQRACDTLRPVWERTKGLDGYVSLEVDPNFAFETEKTIEEAQRLHDWVKRDNLLVKIPATEGGLGAIEEMISRGESINVTLIFGIDRYTAVAEAYIRGLERYQESGGDLNTVSSVASFFVSRVDTEADKRLKEKGGLEDLHGTLAIANAKLAYERFNELFSGERWEKLASEGANPQRCLWASTSMKDEERRDVLYVEELIGDKTVDTMPPETIEAFQDHGKAEATLETGLDEARKVIARFEEAGISYDEITQTLESEGVEKFADSFKELMDQVEEKRGALVPA